MNARDTQILVIGAGFGGLGLAIRLKRAGLDDFLVLDKEDGVGGTWRVNTYPGAACDVESHLYSFSFEPNPAWSRKFAPQAEILAYLERCADKYGVRPHLQLEVEVTGAVWDEGEQRWTVSTADGRRYRAPVLVSAAGGLSRPCWPDLPGLSDFQGDLFHSARWNSDAQLDGRRVAVVGTGASAIQIVPELVGRVAHLDLYQRTPPWIMPKPDRAIAPLTQAAFRRLPALQYAARLAQYVTLESRAVAFVLAPQLLALASLAARRHLARSVPDPALRAKLTPDYTMGCKRVLISNDYYAAVQHPSVALVTDGIERVTADAVVSRDGQSRPTDALILCTGFKAAEDAAPFPVIGRGGRALAAEWHEGAEAYLGTTVAGFPNLFLLVGPNTGLGHNSMVYMIESQVAYVMDALATMRREGLSALEVRRDVQDRYNARVQRRMARTVWASGCKSWYQTASGRNTTLWPGFTFEFRARTRRFDPAAYLTTARPAVRPVSARQATAAAR